MIDEIASRAVAKLPKEIREREYAVIYKALAKAKDDMVCMEQTEENISLVLTTMGGQFWPFRGQN